VIEVNKHCPPSPALYCLPHFLVGTKLIPLIGEQVPGFNSLLLRESHATFGVRFGAVPSCKLDWGLHNWNESIPRQ